MEIFGKTIKQLQKLLAEKHISENELMQYFVDRSKKYNDKLNVYVSINQQTDVDRAKIAQSTALSGIPLAIKDNFCTLNMRTTASASVLEHFQAPYESTVTKKLLDLGAQFIGKTNMDAWAHGSSTETSDFGATKNPWDVTRAPGGSSGGTAAAVAAYLAPAGIGSETAGSIRLPASWCGIVGLKPTYGRVSRYGVVAMGSSFDCPGPMTLTVEDAALLLETIAGQDIFDATTAREATQPYTQELSKPSRLRIGIADEYFDGVDEKNQQQVMDAIHLLEKLGHSVKKIHVLHPKYAISVYTILQRAEVSSNLGRYTGIRYGKDRTFFGNEAKKRIMLGTYTLSQGHYDALYRKAQQVKTLIIEDFQKNFAEVDVIISPTTPITALTLGEFEKYPFFGEVMDKLAEPSAVAGIPGISIPVGLDEQQLPIGLQIMGNYFQESMILNVAYQLERELQFLSVWKDKIQVWK